MNARRNHQIVLARRPAGEHDPVVATRAHAAPTFGPRSPVRRVDNDRASGSPPGYGPRTVLRSLGVMPQLPVEVDDLTPAWMSDAMDTDVTSVTVLDRHSGTTGRAHLALSGDPRLPATVFVKLAPF